MRRHLKTWLIVITLGWALSCTQSTTTQTLLQIPSTLLSDFDFDRIVLEITGPDMPPIKQTVDGADLIGLDQMVFEVDVPVGVDRTFTVTGIVQDSPGFRGFLGSETVDVPEEGVEVPIGMEFVNFALDPAVPDGVQNDPNAFPDIIETAIFRENTDPDCDFNEETIIIEIRYLPAYVTLPNELLRVFIDFDADLDASSGRSPNQISDFIALNGNLPIHQFDNGTERHLSVAFDDLGNVALGQGDLLITGLNPNDVINIGEIPGELLARHFNDAQLGGRTIICITENLFKQFLDADFIGRFNALVGRDDFNNAFPNDLAFTSGSIRYDIDFDSSNL